MHDGFISSLAPRHFARDISMQYFIFAWAHIYRSAAGLVLRAAPGRFYRLIYYIFDACLDLIISLVAHSRHLPPSPRVSISPREVAGCTRLYAACIDILARHWRHALAPRCHAASYFQRRMLRRASNGLSQRLVPLAAVSFRPRVITLRRTIGITFFAYHARIDDMSTARLILTATTTSQH